MERWRRRHRLCSLKIGSDFRSVRVLTESDEDIHAPVENEKRKKWRERERDYEKFVRTKFWCKYVQSACGKHSACGKCRLIRWVRRVWRFGSQEPNLNDKNILSPISLAIDPHKPINDARTETADEHRPEYTLEQWAWIKRFDEMVVWRICRYCRLIVIVKVDYRNYSLE